MAGKLTRYLSVVWDRRAAQQLAVEADRAFEAIAKRGSDEFEEQMQKGGKEAARALSRALQQEYRIRMAKARLDLAEGTIDEKAFEREGREAAEAFNRGLTGGIRRLRAQGEDPLVLAGLTTRFKRVPGAKGRAGIFGGLALGGLAGPLAGVLTASTALSAAQQAIDAADRYDAALQKLEGTARLTGVQLEFLQETSKAAEESFRLSTPVANDLTTEVVKLTQKAGDLNATSDALRSFLDIGAARGLSAAQTLEAIGQAVLGIDEGTDKLFNKNPSAIYAEYAEKIGTSAAKLTDQQKAQALLDATLSGGERVRGEYLKYLESARGQAEQAATEQERYAAAAGKALQPTRELANQLKTRLLEALLPVAEALGQIATWANKAFELELRLKPTIGGKLATLTEWLQFLNPVSMLGRPLPWQRESGSTEGQPGGQGGGTVTIGEVTTVGIVSPPPEEPPPPAVDPEAQKKERERVAALWARLDMPALAGGVPTPEELNEARREWFESLGGTLEEVDSHTDERRRAMLESAVQEMEDHFERIQRRAEEAAYQMASAFQDAFTLMAREGATLGNLIEGIGRGMAGALLSGLAEYAEGKAAENIAAALEATAYALGFVSHGNFASASAAWASAAEHTAAAVAWSALAGGAGAGRAGVTGGAGAIPPSTRDVGFDTARGAIPDPTPIIIEIDPFDPRNPVHAKGIGEAAALDVRLSGGRTLLSAGGRR